MVAVTQRAPEIQASRYFLSRKNPAKRAWIVYNVAVERFPKDRAPDGGEIPMPAHESIDLRTNRLFLVIRGVAQLKLAQKAAQGAAIWLLPMLAITLFPMTASAGFVTARSYPAGLIPVSVAVGDFNGDGITDLAVVDNGTIANQPCKVSVLLGQGDGSFAAPQQYAVGTSAQAIALGDFNGDGVLDIAVSNTADGTVSVLLGNGDGTFEGAKNSSVGGRPTGLAVGDFNGDGLADIAVAIPSAAGNVDGTVTILLSTGDGSFQPAQNTDAGLVPSSLAVGDFNGDGILDLAVANSTASGTLRILLGKGDGTFQAGPNYAVGPIPQTLALGDFNGDGNLDIAVANPGSQTGGGTLTILLGNGDGAFQAANTYTVNSSLNCLAVGDFDSDGNLDLVLVGSAGAAVWLGHGDGTFQAGQVYSAGAGPVAVADFSQDGKLDLAVIDSGNSTGGVLTVFLGKGDGTFLSAPNYPIGIGYCGPLAAGDFNGDGIQDLAFTGGLLDSVSLLLGKGDGTFAPAQNFASGSGSVTESIAVADFNGDGNLDMAVANTAGFSILINDGHWPP
jgi:hypothetical protein